MIAIDVTMAPVHEILSSTVENFSPVLNPLDGNDHGIDVIEKFYSEIYNFLKNCIDKKFILNTVNLSTSGSTSHCRYYATTGENAQAFQEAFADMDAEFSMKKLWIEQGFNVSITQSEIDFDLVDDNMDLIDPDNKLWSLVQPLN